MQQADGTPVLNVETIGIDGGRLDLAARRVDIARIQLDGGRTQLNREADGTVRELTALSTSDRGKLRRELDTALTSADAEGAPWRYAINEIALGGFAVAYADATSEPAVAFDFDAIDLTLSELSNDGVTPILYEGRLQVRQGGGAKVSGRAAQDGSSAEARIELDRLALAGGWGWLKRGGRDRRVPDRFLAWKTLDAKGVALQVEPGELTIDEVRLAGPGAKIVIFEDRTANLTRVFNDGADTEPPVIQHVPVSQASACSASCRSNTWAAASCSASAMTLSRPPSASAAAPSSTGAWARA